MGLSFVPRPHTVAYSSIFTVELVALLALFRIIDFIVDMSFVIFTEPRSALVTLQRRSTIDPLVSLIQRFLFWLHSRKKVVRVCWVPSHVDLPGNEAAGHHNYDCL